MLYGLINNIMSHTRLTASLIIILITFFSCEHKKNDLEIISGKILALQADIDENNNLLISEYKYDTLRKFGDYSSDLIIYIELTTNRNKISNSSKIKPLNHISLFWGETYLINKGFPDGYHDFFYPITSFPSIIDSNLVYPEEEPIKNIIMGGYQIPFPLLSFPMEKDIYNSKQLREIKDDYNNGDFRLINNKIQLVLGMSTHNIGDPAKINGQLVLNLDYSDKVITIIDSLSLKKKKIFNTKYGNYDLDMSEFE